MLIEDVKKLTPMERFLYFVTEREAIRLKKESGAPRPWTDDVIFQRFRFCNIRRINDKTSQWLLNNWYLPNYDHPNMLTAATLARQLNNPESLEAIGFPSVWQPKRVSRILRERAEAGLKNFSAAYMITGTLGGTKIEQIVDKVVTPIHASKLQIDRSRMQVAWKSLLPFAGFATFIAGQVVADLRWAMKGSWRDRNIWAPVGPGSRRGMNRFFGRDYKSPLRQEKFLKELQFVIECMRENLDSAIVEGCEAIDAQNCLCEHDKRERTLFEGRRPKQRYNGEQQC